MKKLPKLNVNFKGLYEMLIAPIRSKLLLTGIELKIFNVLTKPKLSHDVAETIGTHPKNTEVFLDSLAAIGLLQKKDGRYKNSPLAQAGLVETSPTYVGGLLAFVKPDDNFLQNLSKLIKEGPPPPPKQPSFSEEELVKGVELIADGERVGYVQEAVDLLLGLPEFPSFQKMLDLGGGPGIIGMAIVNAHPTMRGVIFDLPPVIKETKKFIKEYNMEDRMEALGGDFNRDSIGEGYDLIWASAVLQFAVDIEMVVKKVHDALNPSGVFVSVFPFGQTPDRTKPEITVLGSLSMALMGQGLEIDQGSIAKSMRRAGFKSVRSQDLDTFMGPMELDIAKKYG